MLLGRDDSYGGLVNDIYKCVLEGDVYGLGRSGICFEVYGDSVETSLLLNLKIKASHKGAGY